MHEKNALKIKRYIYNTCQSNFYKIVFKYMTTKDSNLN